jgi:uncharacterized protein with ATP-grasp and redox domains
MKLAPRCHGCLLSRVELECRLAGADENTARAIRAACARLLADLAADPDLPAPVIATRVHRLAYDLAGCEDPYHAVKEATTRTALETAMAVRGEIRSLSDHVVASVIGNAFDYGVEGHHIADDFPRYFRDLFAQGLEIDHIPAIEKLAERIVYFSDNCGEIVFDRLLVELLKARGVHVTFVVKGAPVLNDATLSDAKALGIDALADDLLTTGSGSIGIPLSALPAPVVRAIEQCTLVIAKGMANYESLTELTGGPPVAYLMAVKCETIAESIGVPRGSLVAILSR